MSENALLLDTCALIYIASGAGLSAEAEHALAQAAATDAIFVSPTTAWELGKLAARGRLQFTIEPLRLLEDFVSRPGMKLCELTPEILVSASFLPDLKHKDPMDQILISTARIFNIPLVTNDCAILAYGQLGHVKTLAC